MAKQLINEYELTQRMINVMRGVSLIKEDEQGYNETPNETSGENPDTITPPVNSAIYNEEVKKIGDIVDQRMQISKFVIYPRDSEVQLEGRLDVGINFFMSKLASKLSISITDDKGAPIKIYLDDELTPVILKLTKYYKIWANEWAAKLNTEYKPK